MGHSKGCGSSFCGRACLEQRVWSVRVCAAEGTLLVIRNNRAEFSPASVWNANPHCRKASFSLTKGWWDGGCACA